MDFELPPDIDFDRYFRGVFDAMVARIYGQCSDVTEPRGAKAN
ncbi:hypothetical protein [Mycobacterium sp.]